MLKKLIRSTVVMIFGSLLLMNLSFAYLSGSVKAEESGIGSEFMSPGGKVVCFCYGNDCQPCVKIEDLPVTSSPE